MRWNTPDFEEINLSGEVTAYANTDEAVLRSDRDIARTDPTVAHADKPHEASA